MTSVKDQKLLKLIKTVPLLSMVIFAFILNLLILNNSREDSKQSITNLQQEIINSEKIQLKQQIENLYERIQYDRMQGETQLKTSIKNRVEEAHAIAINLYNSNKDKSKEEIKALIRQALRPIRFNNGRGYFFIYDFYGVNQLHPIVPTHEQVSLWDLQDVKGQYVIRDLTNLAKSEKEAFHRFWFVKPGFENEEFEKIGFIKSIEPLGWYIGTGEYLVDVEQDLKQQTLEHISQLDMTSNGYVYVIDSNGVTLSHPNPEVIGTNRYDQQNEQGEYFIRDIINAAKNNKGFVEYHSSFLPNNLTSSAKHSYVKYLSDWGWAIGTGFYKQELDGIINDQKQLLEQQNSIQTAKVVSFTIFVTLLFGLLSLILAKKLTLRFERYQHRIALDFQSLSKLKDKLEFSAHHDSLTNLPNRKLFEQTVNHYLKNGDQENQRVGIMFVDLDNFKKINDIHGHAVGDSLLTHVSNQFMSVLGHQDTVSRFGGDEFVFCFPNLDSIEAAEKKAQTVINSLSDSCALSGKVISTGCSAGLAVFPDHGTSIDKLLSNADMALYRTKSIEKGNYLLFDSSLSESQEYDQELEKHLAAALQNREISVHYQPQIDFKTGRMFGIEALARWHNPKLGHVPPGIFIAKAEEIGIINDLGDFIIQQACKEIVSVFPNGLSETNLSINITPSRIKDVTFVDTFTDLIDDSGLSRHRVTLEITENVLIDDLESVAPALTQLRFRQFSIALDDFGTGFSSLGYLNQLPINEIKIDRSFVEKLPHNKQSQSLVNAIIAISSSMNLRVVAEGIETPEQSQWLEKSGCEIAQGYLFAKPMPLNQLAEQYSAVTPQKQAII